MVADIEAAYVDNSVRKSGSVARWVVSVAMVIALTAVTAATLHWYQPLRTLFDDYLGVAVAEESIVEPEAVSRPPLEIQAPTEFLSIEEPEEPKSTDRDSVDVPKLAAEEETEIPIRTSARVVPSKHDPIDAVRIELQFAVVSVTNDRDLVLAIDALGRARSIASTNRMSDSLIESIERAVVEINQLSRLNLDSIQARLDALSKLIVSIGSVRSEDLLARKPDTTIYVSEQPESQGFWNELSDGIANVYRIRRVDGSTPEADEFSVETGTQLRLLMMLERARSDIRVYDFESYRASLNEASAIVDSFSQENAQDLKSTQEELLELRSLELASPYKTIRTALEELTNEAASQTVDSADLDL